MKVYQSFRHNHPIGAQAIELTIVTVGAAIIAYGLPFVWHFIGH